MIPLDQFLKETFLPVHIREQIESTVGGLDTSGLYAVLNERTGQIEIRFFREENPISRAERIIRQRIQDYYD